jgi:hypothetical protein
VPAAQLPRGRSSFILPKPRRRLGGNLCTGLECGSEDEWSMFRTTVLSGPSNSTAHARFRKIPSCSASPGDGAEYNDRALSKSGTPIGRARHPARGGSRANAVRRARFTRTFAAPQHGPGRSSKSTRLCSTDRRKSCTLSDNPLTRLESFRKAFAGRPADIQAPPID